MTPFVEDALHGKTLKQAQEYANENNYHLFVEQEDDTKYMHRNIYLDGKQTIIIHLAGGVVTKATKTIT